MFAYDFMYLIWFFSHNFESLFYVLRHSLDSDSLSLSISLLAEVNFDFIFVVVIIVVVFVAINSL